MCVHIAMDCSDIQCTMVYVHALTTLNHMHPLTQHDWGETDEMQPQIATLVVITII